MITNYMEKIKEYFPKTLQKFSRAFHSIHTLNKKKNLEKIYSEGVALQIIMDKELADQLVYNSHPFGWLKDDLKYSDYIQFDNNKVWEGEHIQSYSELFKNIKNKKDGEQARLSLNNDFRQYPSRVRIKSIAGIMGNPLDYEVVKSMIKEMVEFRYSKDDYNSHDQLSDKENQETEKSNFYESIRKWFFK